MVKKLEISVVIWRRNRLRVYILKQLSFVHYSIDDTARFQLSLSFTVVFYALVFMFYF